MSIPVQAILGLVMMAIGGLKTWLHMGTVPMLSLPTCNGKTLSVALSQSNWFEQAHCWGCYAFALGLGLTMFTAFQVIRERRSVAYSMD